MIEYDNFRLADADILLNAGVLPQRYHPLLAQKPEIIRLLQAHGIRDKYQCIALADSEISRITGLDVAGERLFRALLHLYDFRERKLAETTGIPPAFLSALAERGIRYSSAYFAACLRDGARALAADCGTDYAEALKLLSYCDLMRLPGVKSVRSALYYLSGYINVACFRGGDESEMRARIADTVARTGMTATVPLQKELRTQIAVAAVLPDLYTRASR